MIGSERDLIVSSAPEGKVEAPQVPPSENLESEQILNNTDHSDSQASAIDDDEVTTSSDSYEDDIAENDTGSHIPLLKYTRLSGGPSFKQQAFSRCVCSTMGRVVVTPTKQIESSNGNSNPQGDSSDIANSRYTIFTAKAFYVTAIAHQDGTIRLIDSETGLDICEQQELRINPTNIKKKRGDIVALSFDSGANYLASITAGGDVAIFELHFGLAPAGDVSESVHGVRPLRSTDPKLHLFGNILSKIAGDDRGDMNQKENSLESQVPENVLLSDVNAKTDNHDVEESHRKESIRSILRLIKPASIARFSYSIPDEHRVTCMVLDPSYKRKKEKIIFVGLSNGTLIQTKRDKHGGTVSNIKGFGGAVGSWLQAKRHDNEIYIDPGGEIEALACRGSMLAWADSDGIKIFDMDRMRRLAKIEKPAGARAKLYPHISSLRPTLIFERHDSLLLIWGDCLLNMILKEENEINSSTGSNVRTRTVAKCEMAYELDCVGCDVQPIDGEHLAVLGLSSVVTDDVADLDNFGENDISAIVELQIIQRNTGAVILSDILPLEISDEINATRPSTSNFQFLSSFSTPRMSDEEESKFDVAELDVEEAVSLDINQLVLNTMNQSIKKDSPKLSFRPEHLNWSLDLYIQSILDQKREVLSDTDSVETSNSRDSDNYSFIFRPLEQSICPLSMLKNLPTMVITSPDQLTSVRIRDIDDAIDFYTERMKYGVALKHGLNYRQMIRRNNLDDLINKYLHAVLNSASQSHESDELFKLRRLKLAAKATPVLLGAKEEIWAYWVDIFSGIPGGLFVLRPYLPVRDPKLVETNYFKVLKDMFTEINETILKKIEKTDKSTQIIHTNAVDMFLEAVRAWGNSSSLRYRIKLHKNVLQRMFTTAKDMNHSGREQLRLLNEAEKAFSARMNQSASNYLQLYDDLATDLNSAIHANSSTLPLGVTKDSLFVIHQLYSYLIDILDKTIDNEETKKVILEVLSDIKFMEGDISGCIYYLMKVGEIIFLKNTVIFEEDAVASVRTGEVSLKGHSLFTNDRYLHVVQLIEMNDLQVSILNGQITNDQEYQPPALTSLFGLVGLDHGTRFIIEYCSLPEPGSLNKASLPIDEVAKQLRHHPKILLWTLHRILCEKPEIYVKFPNTAVPPSVVTNLHREHFQLYVDFTDRQNNGKRKLSHIPSYEELNKESPLLCFLKAAMPHGGIRPLDIRKTLIRCRYGFESNDTQQTDIFTSPPKYPHLFARELAVVLERSSDGSEDDANKILLLYLEGVVSLPHAVDYIERNSLLSAKLWDTLISYCLKATENGKKSSNGRIFGSLLEVAARSGSDLAKLVSKIPKSMKVEGIRAKLVTAITDYRLKLEIHDCCMNILNDDKVSLLREQCYCSRRGTRVDITADYQDLKPLMKDKCDDDFSIVLRPWRDGRTRLDMKRKSRRSTELSAEHLGINLPSALEIR